MTTVNDGYNGGAGGKIRKKKVLRKTTPYDRPSIAIRNPNPNNTSKSGFLSRLIYAGADRLLGAFWKRNPALTAAPVTGTNEEQRNEHQEEGPNFGLKANTGAVEPNTNEGGNLANISAATEISDLETMLKEKTFTRLKSRDDGEGDQANISNDSHMEERENFHVVISTHVVNSRVTFEEDVASPAELAKAYMATITRPAKVSPSTLRHGSQAPRQDSVLLNNITILPRTHVTSLAPTTACSLKGVENGMTTPRSRGRSAIYSMARSPYYRGPSTLSKKPMSSLISSQLAWELEGSNGNKMAGKRRSYVLDDLGSGGLMRRIWQKANLYSQGSSLSKHKSELDSSAQRLLAMHLFLPSPLKMASGRGALAGAGVGNDDSMMVDKLPEEINDMKIKVDKVEKEMEATVVDGHGTETGHIIVTTIGDRNGQPKQLSLPHPFCISSYAHSFGPSSAAASSEIKSGSSTSSFTTSNFGSPPFSFGAPSTSTPSTTSSPAVFNAGASTASSRFSFNAASATNLFSQAPFGTPTASFNNNDQMSMEDSMHEDSIQTPSPAIPAFAPASAGKPVFAFNSGTPTPSPSTGPFQFGVQTNQPPSQNPFQVQTNQPPSQNPFQVTNQPPSQNPFQASGSLDLHAGGSFSLGSGGGDKSNRRIVKASKSKNRRK
ncbi:hypothetical protein Tco_0257827 [Tanacetum coccineum]